MIHEHHPLLGREITLRNTPASLVICAAPDYARFNLRIDPAQLAGASKAFELELPTKIGAISVAGDRVGARLGPDEWYLLAAPSSQEAVERAFAELYPAIPHSLVDVGHREVGIDISGTHVVSVLSSAIAFDLGAMPAGTGCRTIFDRTQIVLLREAVDRFRITVWRSYAEHVWQLLAAAGREVELDI